MKKIEKIINIIKKIKYITNREEEKNYLVIGIFENEKRFKKLSGNFDVFGSEDGGIQITYNQSEYNKDNNEYIDSEFWYDNKNLPKYKILSNLIIPVQKIIWR